MRNNTQFASKMNSIREEIQKLEKKTLASYARKSSESKGRQYPEDEDFLRTCFMRDRDRIIHSKSFRRLKHKTQVYISPENDHYRTRLTHTLEVNQISKTIGKAIGLNLDLIEAIALGHDVGHTPFSHTGEEVLNGLLPGGFRHNENSVRVLTLIEQRQSGPGLNLTLEVLDGILHHSGFDKEHNGGCQTLEGQVVRFADKIAYVQHDIDDSIRAGVLSIKDIPCEYLEVLGYTHSKRIGNLVMDIVLKSKENIEQEKMEISLSKEIHDALFGLRQFMFDNVYKGAYCMRQRQKAMYVVEFLFNYFSKDPKKLPEFYQDIVKKEGIHQGVVDYISGMTDNFCIAIFKELVLPQSYIKKTY